MTLHEVVKVVHAGYRCPDPACSAHLRTYRSTAADALALPGFSFGIDVVLLIGQFRLSQHQTLDETHRHVLSRLAPLGVSISRREVLYLFDTCCSLLRVGTEASEDQLWLEQVKQNGGIIVSMDSIQPDKVLEAIYILDILMRNQSTIKPTTIHSDTQGQNLPVFGLAYLLGTELMPRIRNW
jgi:hypothetical protein